MKKILIILVVLVLLGVGGYFLYTYLTYDEYENVEITANEIYEKVLESDYQDLGSIADNIPTLLTLDATQIANEKTYGIDVNLLESYEIGVALMDIRSTEFAVVKVKDEKDVDMIKEKFTKRAKNISLDFIDTLEDQYELAKNASIFSRGPYVAMIISDVSDEMIGTFNLLLDNALKLNQEK